MLEFNGIELSIGHFPDGALLLKNDLPSFACNETWKTQVGKLNPDENTISWRFENNEELIALIYYTKALRDSGVENISLEMFYIPNARQDRVINDEDVFTLKYFADIINSLNFKKVYVMDPHSNVSTALIDRVSVMDVSGIIKKVVKDLDPDMIFYPDEGAMKRYSVSLDIGKPYSFGIKQRNSKTGKIKSLEIAGDCSVEGKSVLIIDDICSRGGTFLAAAGKLYACGADRVYLYVTHCEKTVFEGELLKGDLIRKMLTTDSIMTQEEAEEHVSKEKLEVIAV